ncbi:MAG TPA: rhomboid family intramembrane serine protease [Alphaproteobacteria bacterium]|nr:rhomboid family intramembrane serine protease [Alphaproteobacteria bacterium]HNS43906.1 rhomboid family intramembrane serine protease [Alphaproteobacteria bacterium]
MASEPEDNSDNVIRFTPRTNNVPSNMPPRKAPPMFNIPPITKYLTGFILGLHLVIWALSLALIPDIMQYVALFGGFISGSWTGSTPFMPWTPVTPITSIFIHGSWMHVGVNALMLVAIGSGAEKWLGPKRYMILFILSCWIALLTHLAFSPFSTMPIVGASGGISGLFGAVLLAMRTGTSGMNSNMMPIIIAWIAISVFMGVLGAPDGSSIAWVAHIGGFLGGIGIASVMMKRSGRKH